MYHSYGLDIWFPCIITAFVCYASRAGGLSGLLPDESISKSEIQPEPLLNFYILRDCCEQRHGFNVYNHIANTLACLGCLYNFLYNFWIEFWNPYLHLGLYSASTQRRQRSNNSPLQ